MNPIILEGSDCSGKTTLAKELEKCGYKIIHNGPPKENEDPLTVYEDQLDAAVKVPTVFDRLHIGEMIYGPILRGKSRITMDQFEELNDTIINMGGLVVICLPPWRNVIDCWSNRQAQEHIKEYGQLRESYRKFAAYLDSHPQCLSYDYTRFMAPSFAKAIVELEVVK
jgi:hypothetical protein